MREQLSAIRRSLVAVVVLMVLIVAANVAFMVIAYEKRKSAADRKQRIVKALKELEDERQKTFTDYSEALNSYETKSVMHQLYHASNANLRLQSISVQQQQLLITLVAEE